MDRLLAGPEGQPGKHGGMNYGSRGVLGKKRGTGLQSRDTDDPNLVPQSSMFGFLKRLPWKIGGRRARYKPNVANLQSNVGRRGQEAQPLIDGSEESQRRERQTRNRSDTMVSRSTTNSLSSRGDLFPSDDEADAVPIDDEFAMALERRTTGTTSDGYSIGKDGGKRPSGSRKSTKSASSRETEGSKTGSRGVSVSRGKCSDSSETAQTVPSMTDLKQEEELARQEEEAHVERRRQAARRLASERGLGSMENDTHVRPYDKGTSNID